MSKQGEPTKAVITGQHPRIGRTLVSVLCPCGHLSLWYVWSWAGHGRMRCVGCNRWIYYRTLEVKEG